ncbi:leukocyte surface antigen CD53-like [Haliotis cracherodii]|uniref:leukocyte surface antigen CD53-like n=1 Tax=Haliotis cracherodii TaxID=6455 RepID=UPI0039EA0747
MVAGCGANCMKYTLFFFNILFFLSGVVLAAIGGYTMFSADAWAASLDQNDGSGAALGLIKLIAIVFIVAGFLLMAICFFGCCGAIKEVKCMLGTYAVLIGIVIIAELVVAIRIGMYKGALDSLLEASKEGSRIRVRSYGSDRDSDRSWDKLQQSTQCCGADYWTDFKKDASEWKKNNDENYEVPVSCCRMKDPSSSITTSNLLDPICPTRPTRLNSYIGTACNDNGGPLTGLFRVFFFSIIGVILGLIAIELVGIIFAICLIRFIGDPRAVPV